MHHRRSVGLRTGPALALLTALVAACSSSSGTSTFGGGGDDGGKGSGGGSGSDGSSGSFSLSLPLCPGCAADGGGGGACPTGWTTTSNCHCFLPGLSCVDPVADCSGIQSVCLPEPTLDGAGNRCHCSCPGPLGYSCG